jgi:hypothetical protein
VDPNDKDQRVVEFVRKHGPRWSIVEAETGLTYCTAEGRWRRGLKESPDGQRAMADYHTSQVQPKKPEITGAIDLPPRPFAVPVPVIAPREPREVQTAIYYSDTHFPYQCDRTLSVVMALIEDLQPDLIVNGGDMLDCYAVSRFDKDPSRLGSLQSEIDMGRTHLHQVSQLCPTARKVWLEGNHEFRLTKALWSLSGVGQELARLGSVVKALEWPNLLQLDDIGWEFFPYKRQHRNEIIPRLILKHGNVVRKWSAYTAKGEWEKFGKSGVSGHVHRLGQFFHRNLRGANTWVEAGCTCTLDPEYVDAPDWQNGCVVIEYTDDWHSIRPLYIEDGRTLYNGKWYEAK